MLTNQTKASEDATQTTKGYADLSRNLQQKYAHLQGVYSNEELILQLVQLIEPRGENSWRTVTDKINKLRRCDYKQQMYDDALSENFEIGKMYTSADIIRTVGIVRDDMDLQVYISSLKKNCETDFNRLFIVHTVTTDVCCVSEGPDSGKTKTLTVGYKPMFRLKPED